VFFRQDADACKTEGKSAAIQMLKKIVRKVLFLTKKKKDCLRLKF
jgi:hypothetical protein